MRPFRRSCSVIHSFVIVRFHSFISPELAFTGIW